MKLFLFILISLSNFAFGQIKSVKQVKYHLFKDSVKKGFHENKSKDSCVVLWEEYNQLGNLTTEYLFPSDRCWKIDGPWENHYYYNENDSLIKVEKYGGKEGMDKNLMSKTLYSYPNNKKQYIETYIKYELPFSKKSSTTTSDTLYVKHREFADNRNTKKLDTINFTEGILISERSNKPNPQLFKPKYIKPLLNKSTIKEFEIALIDSLKPLATNFNMLFTQADSWNYKIEFIESKSNTSLCIETHEYSMEISYKFLDNYGNCYMEYNYKTDKSGSYLEKSNFIKTEIVYY